jgi:hypothetical protein
MEAKAATPLSYSKVCYTLRVVISAVLPANNEARGMEEGLCRASEALAKEIPVGVLRRPERQGLATTVVDGWRIAQGETVGEVR